MSSSELDLSNLQSEEENPYLNTEASNLEAWVALLMAIIRSILSRNFEPLGQFFSYSPEERFKNPDIILSSHSARLKQIANSLRYFDKQPFGIDLTDIPEEHRDNAIQLISTVEEIYSEEFLVQQNYGDSINKIHKLQRIFQKLCTDRITGEEIFISKQKQTSGHVARMSGELSSLFNFYIDQSLAYIYEAASEDQDLDASARMHYALLAADHISQAIWEYPLTVMPPEDFNRRVEAKQMIKLLRRYIENAELYLDVVEAMFENQVGDLQATYDSLVENIELGQQKIDEITLILTDK